MGGAGWYLTSYYYLTVVGFSTQRQEEAMSLLLDSFVFVFLGQGLTV